jgi:hypothetical protein
MATKKGKELDLQCAFGDVSIGDHTARVGVTVERSELTVSQADKSLCEKRLIGRITSKPADEHPDQQRFEGMESEDTLNGIFDVKQFSVTKKAVKFGMTFALKSIDIATLSRFAQRNGKLAIDSIDAIPEPKKETKSKDKDGEDEEGEE